MPKYTPEQRVKFMAALDDDRVSARVKEQIENILNIRTPSELAEARRIAAKADWHARKAGIPSATAQARQAQAARRSAAARRVEAAPEPLQPVRTVSAPTPRPEPRKAVGGPQIDIVRAAREAGVTAAQIAAQGRAIPQFIEDVFAGRRKALPWMFAAIEAAAAGQAGAAD